MSRHEPDEPVLPIAFHPLSNGEYAPLTRNTVVRETVRRTLATADDHARRLGISRRAFLRSSAGQIDAFRTFEITPEFQESFGYPALADEVKARILGLNAARLYGIDPTTTRCTLSRADRIELRREMPLINLPDPAHRRGGCSGIRIRPPLVPALISLSGVHPCSSRS